MDKKSMIVAIIIIILLCITSYFTINTTLSKLAQPNRDILIVGTSTPFPPFETRAGDAVIGFDIDLTEQIATKLNRRMVVKDFSDFDALLPSLKSGNLDMVIAGLSIYDARKEVVDFSDPYYNSSQSILTLQNGNFSDKVIYQPSDFEGLIVGYQTQTTSQFWVEGNLINKTNIKKSVSFGNLQLGLDYLKMNVVDVIIIDKPVADAFVHTNSNLKIIGTIETKEQYAIAVQKDDPEGILSSINGVLSEMKANGEYDKLIAKWFGG